jgi:diguanylate cyclase (GGDEF)-like protein
MAKPPDIVLLTADPHQRRSWEETLQPWAVCRGPDGIPDLAVPPEVIVTDRLPVTMILSTGGQALLRGEIGIVAVGVAGPADVSLPADYSTRELRLACQLLVQIVRLRRRRHQDCRARRTLHELASRDPLTNLPNRRTWDACLAARLKELGTRSTGMSTCVVLLDIDYFKRVNDLGGHAVGDAVLRAVASRLSQIVRAGDAVARVGGDEFGLLLEALAPAAADGVVERIRSGLAHDCRDVDGPPVRVTASAGYVSVPVGRPVTAQQALTVADTFLRQAKAAGRDRTIGGLYVA